MNTVDRMEVDRMDKVYRDLGFRRLYRYFRTGGIYRYEPKSRLAAARLAWAYSRKGSDRG